MATTNNHLWVVASAGARDSYQVPIALHESGLLKTLVTDFYAPLDLPLIATASNVLPLAMRSKLSRRFSPSLPSRLVLSHLPYALRNWWEPEAWIDCVGSLGEYAARIADRHDCSILAYAHVATTAFTVGRGGRRVLMQMQPHPAAVKAALLSDRFLPDFQDHFRNEISWPREVFERFSREPHLADSCIAASSYTRKTLIDNGISPDRVSVIPYGVDLEFFSPADSQRNQLSVLFVGQLCRQKGLHYLLEAWRRLAPSNAELRIVGVPHNKAVISQYMQVARFLGRLNWRELREEYRRADLLCLPSLSENSGQVILEAIACGTPVLTTTSCGASDLIRHGESGLVIPPAHLEFLISSLEWASRNRDKVREMRAAARSTAEQYPWSKFRKNIVEQLRSLTIHGK